MINTPVEKPVSEWTVAIPVFNAYDALVACLDSLDRSYPTQTVVLVDDCSTDTRIRQHFAAYAASRPRKTVLVMRSSRGWFTRAANTALRSAWEVVGDWVVLLNSDTVVDAGAFEEMYACWQMAAEEGHTVGLVGCEGPQPSSHMRWSNKLEPGYVTGHCYLLNRQVMEREDFHFPQGGEWPGLLADSVFHIDSDHQLCHWMHMRGYATIASYWAAVGHHGGASWGHRLQDLARVSAAGLQD